MFDILLGFFGAFVVIGLVFLFGKSVKVINRPLTEEPTAREVARQMPQSEKDEIIQDYAGDSVEFSLSDNIFGEASDLHIDFLDCYGVRYSSVIDVLNRCSELTEDEIYSLELFDETLVVVRKELLDGRRHLQVKSMLDEDIYVYEPCKMKLDVPGQDTARVAITLVRAKNLSMSIESVFVSKEDVTNISTRYEFDMLNLEDVESFSLLVRKNDMFTKEVEQLEIIEKHLARYNELVKNNRVGLANNGEIIIYPPSPEEIKANREKLKQEIFGDLSNPRATVTDEEFVSSQA